MESLDIVEVLSYGLGALAFLLLFGSFYLLRQESNRAQARSEIVRVIRVFMGITILCIAIVGILGVPTVRNYQLLSRMNDTLRVEKFQALTLYHLKKNNEILIEQNKALSQDSILELLLENEEALDSLSGLLEEFQAEHAESLKAMKEGWNQKIKPLQEDSLFEEKQRQKVREEIIAFQKKVDQLNIQEDKP